MRALRPLRAVDSTYSNLGRPVEVDGRWVFSSFDVEIEWHERPKVHASIAFRDGRWVVTALALTATASCPVITVDHRQWAAGRDFDDLLTIALPIEASSLRFGFTADDGEHHSVGEGDLRAFAQGAELRQKRRWITAEHLERVAAIYRAASRYPAKAVADQFKVSRPTANRWIAQAKQEGLL